VLHGSSSVLTLGAYMVKRKNLFVGTEEHRMKPNELSGDQLLHQLKNLKNVQFRKDENGKSRK
jgi:hypothetical protein